MAEAIQSQYEAGRVIGCRFNAEEHEAFRSEVAIPDAEDVCHSYGFADRYNGQLVVPFVHVMEAYPNAWPGPGQKRGDCESKSVRNALLGSLCCEVASGTPDEASGKVEQCPEVSSRGEKNGVLASEAIYLHAGHSNRKDRRGRYVDDGWYVGAAARVVLNKSGAVVRKNFPGVGIDFESYDPNNGGFYGGRMPPPEYVEATNDNLFREATESEGDADRDMLGRGFFIGTDGSESFSKTRDDYGVASRAREIWHHAMAKIGVDDRKWAHDRYGGPLDLILNSWKYWNRGPRDIHESAKYVPADKRDEWVAKGIVNRDTGNIMIPRGAFWARRRDVSRRRGIAFSGCNGWERRELPDYMGGWQ